MTHAISVFYPPLLAPIPHALSPVSLGPRRINSLHRAPPLFAYCLSPGPAPPVATFVYGVLFFTPLGVPSVTSLSVGALSRFLVLGPDSVRPPLLCSPVCSPEGSLCCGPLSYPLFPFLRIFLSFLLPQPAPLVFPLCSALLRAFPLYERPFLFLRVRLPASFAYSFKHPFSLVSVIGPCDSPGALGVVVLRCRRPGP